MYHALNEMYVYMFILHYCDVRVFTHNFPSQAATYFVRAWCGEGGAQLQVHKQQKAHG